MFGAIATGLAGVAGGVLGYFGQKEANKTNLQIANQATQTNISEAEKNRQFQEHQRGTQYQTAMQDMRAAGLNPMLAYQQGGAGTTGGATGSAQMAHMENVHKQSGEAIKNAIASAQEARRINKEIKAVDSQVNLNEQLKATASAQEALNTTSAYKADNEARLTSTIERLKKLEEPAIKAEANYRKKEAEMNTRWLQFDNSINRINRAIQPITSAASLANPLSRILQNAKTVGDKTKTSKNWGKVNKRTGEIHD